ncbi:MAG: hypothetical protein A2Y79_06665 [Deltaproteobacteria bacterium RBG_13_43_22]|nr:MAG: hypothetical protein A2Y79_06665 [Deltaproteobacteria bacterium RBG_13_43_22]
MLFLLIYIDFEKDGNGCAFKEAIRMPGKPNLTDPGKSIRTGQLKIFLMEKPSEKGGKFFPQRKIFRGS